ncbi:MAG: CRISPR system precrRNA processing endoribonuclease RAMP protein Cas6 [Promethearchaeia archaeon]
MIQFTFELYPKSGKLGKRIPYGYKFRGVIMNWLSESNPELADTFHKKGEVRPYAINTIPRRKESKIEFILTSYNEQLSDTVVQDLLKSEKTQITADGQDFYIAKITFERPNLAQMQSTASPITKFQIHFVTPIYLNTIMGNYPLRFPIPQAFFGNLVNQWNDMVKEENSIDRDDLLEWIGAHMYISGYKMKTVKRDIGKGRPLAGGIGNATYRIKKINSNFYKYLFEDLDAEERFSRVQSHYKQKCEQIDLLCKIGVYTNVGGNRTAGMGVIRYFPKTYLEL